MWRWIWFKRRVRCWFGFHFWCGVLKENFDWINSEFDNHIDYYTCLSCNKEQTESPYRKRRT